MEWLIDGHNLIGQMPTMSLDDPDDEEKLLAYLRRYQARTGHKLTVIFDPGPGRQLAAKYKRGGVKAQFVSAGQTADQILIRRIRQVKNPQAVMVVTSDRAIEQVAQQAGLRVMPARDFARQLLEPDTNSDQDDRSDLKLSAQEVEAWLAIFKQRRT